LLPWDYGWDELMPEFLVLKKPLEALDELLRNIPQVMLKKITVPTGDSLGRISAEIVVSPEQSPAFRRSAVDGYALIARDSFGSSESLPAFFKVIGEIRMGKKDEYKLNKGETVMIHTGGMLPEKCDAVVMMENTQISRSNEIEVFKAVSSGENILEMGEDLNKGEEILYSGKIIRSADIGGLLAVGINKVTVYEKPRIGILSSGDELVSPSKKPKAGQVRDINSSMLAALLEKHGGLPVIYPIMPDDSEKMNECITGAFKECDSLIITAGSSASTRDFTAQIVRQLGKPGILSHGVNIKPGKPTILAVCGGKPVIGLPGNPVSALVIAILFVIPMVKKLSGITRQFPLVRGKAKISVNLASVSGREDYWPVKITQSEGEIIAEPIFYKSNLIFSLVKADGLAIVPADANGIAAGELIEFIQVE
jgi:molybdopterin molybdotransferase